MAQGHISLSKPTACIEPNCTSGCNYIFVIAFWYYMHIIFISLHTFKIHITARDENKRKRPKKLLSHFCYHFLTENGNESGIAENGNSCRIYGYTKTD